MTFAQYLRIEPKICQKAYNIYTTDDESSVQLEKEIWMKRNVVNVLFRQLIQEKYDIYVLIQKRCMSTYQTKFCYKWNTLEVWMHKNKLLQFDYDTNMEMNRIFYTMLT